MNAPSLLKLGHLSSVLGHQSCWFSGLRIWTELYNRLSWFLQLTKGGRRWHVAGPISTKANSHDKSLLVYLCACYWFCFSGEPGLTQLGRKRSSLPACMKCHRVPFFPNLTKHVLISHCPLLTGISESFIGGGKEASSPSLGLFMLMLAKNRRAHTGV